MTNNSFNLITAFIIITLFVVSVIGGLWYWFYRKSTITTESSTITRLFSNNETIGNENIINELIITTYTKALNDQLTECLENYVKGSSYCGPDIMCHSLGNTFPDQVIKIHNIYRDFISDSKDRIIVSLLKRLQNNSKDNDLTKVSWDKMNLANFNLDSLDLWNKLNLKKENDSLKNEFPQLISTTDLILKFEMMCDSFILYLSTKYPNGPSDLVKRSNTNEILRDILDTAVENTLDITIFCDQSAISDVVKYTIESRSELWKNLPDGEYRKRISDIEYILSIICNLNKLKQQENEEKIPEFTTSKGPVKTISTSKYIGDINLPESDVSVKKNSKESFCSFPF